MAFASRTKSETITTPCSGVLPISDAGHCEFATLSLNRHGNKMAIDGGHASSKGAEAANPAEKPKSEEQRRRGANRCCGKFPDGGGKQENSSVSVPENSDAEALPRGAQTSDKCGMSKKRPNGGDNALRAFCEADTLAENEIKTGCIQRKFDEKASLVKNMLSSPETEDERAVSESAMVMRMRDENKTENMAALQPDGDMDCENAPKKMRGDGKRRSCPPQDASPGMNCANVCRRTVRQCAQDETALPRHDKVIGQDSAADCSKCGDCGDNADLSMEETALIEIPDRSDSTVSTPIHTPMPSHDSDEASQRAYSSEIEIGNVVAGRYEIMSEVARGGYGIVYRARQLGVDRIVALKRLRSQSDPSVVQRFMCEMQMIKDLVHPNTIQLIDAGMDDSHMFIVMEYIDGESLHGILRKERRLVPLRAIHIARQVLKSVNEAHRRGIIHRDIKPSNILIRRVIGEPDFVKVLDFGIAKSKDTAGMNLTRSGHVMGTPHYLAPESLLFGEHCYQSDIFAIGLILYEMITGKQALTGTVNHVMEALTKDIPIPGEYAGTTLSYVLQKALARRPSDRYETAAEMINDLNYVEREIMQSISAPAANGTQSRSAPPAFIVGGIVLFVLNLGFWLYLAYVGKLF